jgi:hypothetical protein
MARLIRMPGACASYTSFCRVQSRAGSMSGPFYVRSPPEAVSFRNQCFCTCSSETSVSLRPLIAHDPKVYGQNDKEFLQGPVTGRQHVGILLRTLLTCSSVSHKPVFPYVVFSNQCIRVCFSETSVTVRPLIAHDRKVSGRAQSVVVQKHWFLESTHGNTRCEQAYATSCSGPATPCHSDRKVVNR